ncbi:MAG: FeoA family protein [Tepidisphaeraceae bacterium]|jgi:Fe2+ transport system protein FeoA
MEKVCTLPQRNHSVSPGTCRLNELGIGCTARVVSVGGDAELRRRLLEMGFCNGAQVQAIRRAPLGDPIEFSLRGYHLSLRKEQARHVKVAPAAGETAGHETE